MCRLAFVLAFLAAFRLPAQVLVNEVHPTPVAGEPEWVELLNTSDKAVRLVDWFLCDARTCVRLDDVTIPPRRYAVVTRDTAALREVRSIDADVVLIEVHAPSLNNTTDKIFLRRADSVLIDSVGYTMAWGRKGISLERSVDVNGHMRWMASLSADSATCGYLNSTVRLAHDIRIADLQVNARSASLDVVVHNFGLLDMTAATLTVTANGIRVLRERIGALAADADVAVTIDATTLRTDTTSDSVLLRAMVDVDDDRTANNVMQRTIVLPPTPGSIVINEVMFDPLPTQCDYVEVLNMSGRPFDLEGWMICGAGEEGSRDTLVVRESAVIDADSCGVIATDTIVHAMMSDDAWMRTVPHQRRSTYNIKAGGDAVVLLNPSGFYVDSVEVQPQWHSPALPSSKGVSLERMHPILTSTAATSWTSSASLMGGTPGTRNSVSIRIDDRAEVRAHPSPCSTDPTSTYYPSVIQWTTPYQQCLLFVRLFKADGTVVRDLLNNTFGGAIGAVAWDGRDDGGNAVAPGPYIISVLAVDAATAATHWALAIVVVGE